MYLAKGQIVNILSFSGQTVPAATSQLYCCSAKADVDSMYPGEHDCVSIKAYLRKQAAKAMGCSLPTTVLGAKLMTFLSHQTTRKHPQPIDDMGLFRNQGLNTTPKFKAGGLPVFFFSRYVWKLLYKIWPSQTLNTTNFTNQSQLIVVIIMLGNRPLVSTTTTKF